MTFVWVMIWLAIIVNIIITYNLWWLVAIVVLVMWGIWASVE